MARRGAPTGQRGLRAHRGGVAARCRATRLPAVWRPAAPSHRAGRDGQSPCGGAYRSEGRRLVATAQAVDLVARALRGEVFRPQIRAGRPEDGRTGRPEDGKASRPENRQAQKPAGLQTGGLKNRKPERAEGRGAAWTEEQSVSEPPGRGAAWTEERGTSGEGRRRLKAPRRASESTSGEGRRPLKAPRGEREIQPEEPEGPKNRKPEEPEGPKNRKPERAEGCGAAPEGAPRRAGDTAGRTARPEDREG